MQLFLFIWFGQLISLLGSGLTNFALGIWVYQHTGSVTLFALISLFTTLPYMVISPVAGALVDRWNRRWVMIISDSGAGIATLILTILLFSDRLEIWHIYLITSINSFFGTFQKPAYIAATTLIVPKSYLSRASGMVQLGEAVSQLLAPILAGLLIVTIKLHGIILIDFATFIFGVVTLLGVQFPHLETRITKKRQKTSILREALSGWTYLTARPGLLALLLFFTTNNLLVGVVSVLVTPLVLSFASSTELGMVMSIGGTGMLVGSLVMSTWGGPPRHINGVFGFMFLSGLCIVAAGLRASIPLLVIASFLAFFGMPIINGSSQIIFQKKVDPQMQGRVFAFNLAFRTASSPIAYGIAGPLADRVFEPLMAVNGPLASTVGRIIGTGDGRGIALIFIIMGFLTMLATIAAYQYSPLRFVEDKLPDIVPEVGIDKI